MLFYITNNGYICIGNLTGSNMETIHLNNGIEVLAETGK
jgi:hypothetical protein